jgi:hypothetical protein
MNKSFYAKQLTKENVKSWAKGLLFALIQAAAGYVIATQHEFGLESTLGGLVIVSIANLVYQYERSDK